VTIRLADLEPSPDVFAAVMATGILSVAAANHHYREISETMGILATLGLVVLLGLVVGTRRFAAWRFKDPDVTLRLFTFVAACAVLDSRLATQPILVWLLAVAALASWLVLIVVSARNMWARGWSALRDEAHGAWELASVGTSGLAIVATKVAVHTPAHGVLYAAVPIWVAALGIYCLMTFLILWRTVAERQDRDGFEPDTWILMGGLAIATLAGDTLHAVAPPWLAGPVRAVTVVIWVAATLWIPPLIYFGLRRISRRPTILRFAGVWWALVFPLGMYSAASYAMAAETHRDALLTVSLVFFWDALAAWLIVVVAGVLRLARAVFVSQRAS
jgi:tellurite resistance protein TehA-like permease